MPRATEWGERLKRLEERLYPENRFVDCAFQFQEWNCSCGHSHAPQVSSKADVLRNVEFLSKFEHRAVPGRILEKVYGGRFDRLLRRSAGEAKQVKLVSCHAGQVPVLTFENDDVLRILALGTPGSGKSFAAERRALKEACQRSNSIGAIITPTGKGRERIWNEFLELVRPLGFVEEVAYARSRITLVNRSVILVLAAKASGEQYGSPLQGYTLDWAVVDESQNVTDDSHSEIAQRGRLAGRKFFILETATNAQVPSFRVRLEEFKSNPQRTVIRFTGDSNPWVPYDWWKILGGDMTERQFQRLVLAEDVPPELLVYPEFDYKRHVTEVPKGARDVTESLVYQHFRRDGVKWIAAQDFGVLTSCTEMLKCYELTEQDPSGIGARTKRIWFALDEITSGSDVTADLHARKILERYEADSVLVVADPHFNTKDSDKADYSLFQRQGLQIVPAVHGKVKREHRYSMVNLLLRDDHLFIKAGRCRKLIESFMGLQRNEFGEAERDRKDRHDLSHWTAALGYGLFPFEKIRGAGTLRAI